MKRSSNATDRVRETATEYGPPHKVSATEAARNFSEILNRVKYRGESFIIERNGEAIGELRPATPSRCTVRDLVGLMRALPEVDADYLRDLEELIRAQPALPESPWER